MKLTFLKSATVCIENKKKNILIDPWLADGEYYGSWYHYPKFNLKKFLNNKIDFIYISHIHPDHMSRKTLEKINKSTKIIIHKYAFPFFRINLEKIGFKNIIELGHGERFYFEKNFFIEIFGADDCNPKLCGKFFKCHFLADKIGSQQIDSIAVISNNNSSILNVNDCPYELSKSLIKKILKKFKKIDLLLTGYSGAGPFPQCFKDYSNKKKNILANKKKKQFLNQAVRYIKDLNPNYVMPFAGTYFLGSKLHKLNDKRGVPTRYEAYKYLMRLNKKKEILSRPIILKTFGQFDIQSQKIKDRLNYDDGKITKKMKLYLKGRTLDYYKYKKPKIKELQPLLSLSGLNMFSKSSKLGIRSDKTVLISLSKKKFYMINFKNETHSIVDETKIPKNNFIKLNLDLRLLNLILKGPKFAHWDNADIGSHIQYQRKPDKYDRQINHVLNFFHC